MKTDIMLAIRKGVYIPAKEVFAAIDDCMDDGLYMPADICAEMGWRYPTLRQSLEYQKQYTMSEYIKRERVYRLTMLAVENRLTPDEAAQLVGMKIREANNIMKLIIKKTFLQVRNESKQRNADASATDSSNSYRRTTGHHLHR